MMVKVMNNKQAIELPRAEKPATPAESKLSQAGKPKGKGEQEFDAQLMAEAALIAKGVPPIQPQPLAESMAQAMAAAQGAKAKEGEQQAAAKPPTGIEKTQALMKKAQGLTLPSEKAAAQAAAEQSLKTAASLNTGSAIAGLTQQGKPALQPAAAGLSTPQDANASGEEILRATATRGEADAALASKLSLLSSGKPWMAQPGMQPTQPDASVGMQPMTQAQALAMLQQPQHMQMPAHLGQMDATTAQDAALEAQLASMAGVIQGFEPQTAEGAGAAGARGRTLVPGAKGRTQGGAAQAGLSGGEFLSALGAAKGGVNASRFEQGSQFQGEQGEGKAGGGKSSSHMMHVIQGGAKKAGFESDLTASQSMANLAANSATHAGTAPAAEVTGHVVPGANSENRLSSESLTGISTSLRNFSTQGGGEMHIRLKPENLGELHVRVMTDGTNVGLHIQASDEKSKKILEESLSHLKDSMATQNLTLGKVELTVAQSQGAAFGENRGEQGQWQGQGQNLSSDMFGQGERRGDAWGANGEGTGFGRAARAGSQGSSSLGATARSFGPARAAYAASGRLDVTA